MDDTWIRDAVRIARVERRRQRRGFDGDWGGRTGRLLVGLAVAAGLGAVAASFGRDLAAGRAVPIGDLSLVAGVGFAAVVWYSARATHARFGGLNPEFLLPATTIRAVGLGLLLFVSGRVAAALALPTVGVAVGTAVGRRSPAVALTVAAAVAVAATAAVGLGVAGRLAARLVGRRLRRGRDVRDLLVAFGWAAILGLWLLLGRPSVSAGVSVGSLRSLPMTWVVDLALLPASDRAGLETARALGAIAILVPTAALAAGLTGALVRRLWTRDPPTSRTARGSRSIVGGSRLDRLLGSRVSQPVRVVARTRLLAERRVPRGLLSTSYVLLFAGVVLLPLAGLLGAPLLPLLTVALGLAAGVVVGDEPVGVTYRVLPMLLTTVGGRQFVAGMRLATLVVAVPLVAVVVVPIGLVSPAGVAETAGLLLAGVAIGVCTASLSLAAGLGVERDDLVPVPMFFTDVTVYAASGSAPFKRLGAVFVLGSLIGVPAMFGNAPLVYERVAAYGVPIRAVRLGGLLVTALLATLVSRRADRIADERYRSYRLE